MPKLIKTKTKKSKTYSLTSNSTGAFVNNYINRLRKSYKQLLKDSEIPAFIEISRTHDPLAQYFLDRIFHIDALGANNIRILDRIMREAIATNIAHDVRNTLNSTGTYPGLWSELDIAVLALTQVNIEIICDKEGENDLYLVLSMSPKGRITEEELLERDVSTWMSFNDYNPNRLYQHCTVVQNQIVRIIVNEINNSVPAANLAVNTESAATRYGRGLIDLIREPIEEWKAVEDEYRKLSIDEQAQKFISIIEGPLLNYASILAGDTGISGKLLRRAFEASKAKVSYSNSIADGGRRSEYFVHPWTKMNYQLYYSTDKNLSLGSGPNIIVSPNDLVIICKKDDAISLNTKRYAIDRVGSALQSFMIGIVRYAINIYLMERGSETMTDAPEEPDPSESDGIEVPEEHDDTLFE